MNLHPFKLISLLALSLPFITQANYFASQSVQSQTPSAFALQPESKAFVEQAAINTNPTKFLPTQ